MAPFWKRSKPATEQPHEKDVAKPNSSDDSDSNMKEKPDAPSPTGSAQSAGAEGLEIVGKPHPTKPGILRADGKRELTENDCFDKLGYSFPTWKKWSILSVIFLIQLSMNFNTSVYPNAITPISQKFGVSEQAARVGQMDYLVAYAFASELWAPWSEEFGRWPIIQLSTLFINIWQIPAALAPNFGTIVVARFLGGASTAGGSVTLGMVADLFEPNEQQWAVAFIVLSSVGGTSIGPVVGGPIQKYLALEWNFWVQLIFGGTVQLIHFFFVPETRATIMLDKEAKRRRKSGEDPDIYGPNELRKPRISMKEIGKLWIRPFEMFLREPIVLLLSLLSGFSDALIFTFIEGFTPVYAQWNFGVLETAWAFIPINIGYLLAYFSYFPWIRRDENKRKRDGDDSLLPERRLKWLLFLAPLEPLGLFGFAWTSLGPPQVHWIAPMIFSVLIAAANYAIYMSTIDYMVASYGVYSASATGGNALARDFLAGISAMYATPLYSNIGNKYPLEYASTILACLAVIVVIPIYFFYWKGPEVRAKSKFAQELASDRKANQGRRVSSAAYPPDHV